jgi:signal transduction histidine kinase
MKRSAAGVDSTRAPILLVDDRPDNLVALEAVLASPAYEIVCARSGSDALEQLGRRDFAVALLDVHMPAMDGLETALKMKQLALDKERNLSLIFVTGVDADRVRIVRAYEAGAVDFIQKPLDPDIVRAKVSVFVDFYWSKDGLRRRMEDAVRAREDLLAIVSHELRNPLSIVLMGARQIDQLAEDNDSGARTRRAARSIVKAVDRMSRLVGDLLDLAQLEAGKPLPLESETYDVTELAQQAAELLEPLASARRLRLITDVLGPMYALCDADRIQQVLANLIVNAIKFTREGGEICVRVRSMPGTVVVSVSDTGVGIPAAQIPHLFDAYWQVDSQRKRGAGLGLSIAKAIVVAHGGRIWVESTEGRGSTFFVTLPAAGAPPA